MVALVTESGLRQCVDVDKSGLDVITEAFEQLAGGQVRVPPTLSLDIPERHGAADVKTAYVAGWDSFAIKLSTRFSNNEERGLTNAGGMITLLDSDTGQVKALLLDNGYLTTVRTALAGALAARQLAPYDLHKVAVIGAGNQALWQLRALALVRQFTAVGVYARREESARDYAQRVHDVLDVPVDVAGSPEEAVRDADLVITTTASDTPLIEPGWLKPGVHVTAIGSDAAHKNEIAPAVLAHADLVVCDVIEQCRERGELHHAIDQGLLKADQAVALGDILVGRARGRTRDDQVTVCDLTGGGVQDTAIARWALERAWTAGQVQSVDN